MEGKKLKKEKSMDLENEKFKAQVEHFELKNSQILTSDVKNEMFRLKSNLEKAMNDERTLRSNLSNLSSYISILQGGISILEGLLDNGNKT